jgi:hypothetical protein
MPQRTAAMALIALEFRGLPSHDPFYEPEQLSWRQVRAEGVADAWL